MGRNLWLACGLLLALAPALWADVMPIFNNNRAQRMWAEAMNRHNFAIERDAAITRAKLIIPRTMLPAGATAQASPSGARVSGALPAGVAMACCFGTGGLWLARARWRALLVVATPLLLLAVASTLSWGNTPFRPSLMKHDGPPVGGAPLISSEVDVYIAETGDHVRLILPTKAP